MTVRVRFAPSPTGYLHVGGLRTALYNYLFARHSGGKMILRIEDTDRTRFVPNAQENLIKMLEWAGITPDEGPGIGGDFGPYIQSERTELYRKYVGELMENGKAYYAFDTAEELAAKREQVIAAGGSDHRYDRAHMRNSLTLGNEETQKLIASGAPYVIRMLVPENVDVVFDDIIRGEVKINTNETDDQVLLKSDGFPTYHLANVVDDHLMGITHVIRGEEWLPSTPKHCLLYDAFGWQRPQFAHLPLLLNKDKTKLSKRQGSVAVEDFKEKYYKPAFLNFVALLGWNPSADREIYSMEELSELFRLDKVNKAGAVFDLQKLDWFNFHYIKELPKEELGKMLAEELEHRGMQPISAEYAAEVCDLLRERVNRICDIPDYAPYFFTEGLPEYEEKYLAKHWNAEKKPLLEELCARMENLPQWDQPAVHDLTMAYCEEKQVKLKEVIHPLRLMVTGKSIGAGMFETMEVLGRNRCIERMKEFLKSN